MKEELTLLNYQQRFSALINHERDAHRQELMKKSVASLTYHVEACGLLIIINNNM